LGDASLDVSVDVGPSSSSKRATIARTLASMSAMSDDPETKQVLMSMAMMNIEGEGISEARQYFRSKLVKMGVIKPTEEEAAELQQQAANTPPDPNTVYLQAAAESEQAKAVNKADQAKADTMKTLSEIDLSEQQAAMNVIEKFGGVQQVNGNDVSQ
jgi:hypothetical protein